MKAWVPRSTPAAGWTLIDVQERLPPEFPGATQRVAVESFVRGLECAVERRPEFKSGPGPGKAWTA
eukprot:1158124-Pelagomonas_calceolata.AAC.3